MAIKIITIIFALLSVFNFFDVSSAAMPIQPETGSLKDFHAAIEDMRAKSFYGFAILLQMLNTTTKLTLRNITFFIPQDPKLSNISIPIDHLEEFVLSHLMAMPLQFSDLLKFPTGSMVPSGYHNRMIRIRNLHGRGNFDVNNAALSVPNVCSSSQRIKCHGIKKVFIYGTDSYGDDH